MKHLELIQKYFNNSLSKEETLLFDELLEHNIAFKDAFEEHRDATVAFKIYEKEKLKSLLNSKQTSGITVILKNKSFLIALASCLIIGLFYVSKSVNSNDLFDNYYEPYPNVYAPIVRGENTSLTEAFKAYENGDFGLAENEFKLILKKDKNPNLRFYYAMTLLNQGETKDALKVLELIKTENHDFLPETFWYSALIYLKDKNYIDAKTSLTKLQNLNSTF
jgi:hypothetical protein